MKYRITIETEDEFERVAIINAVKNKVLIDGLYDEVFRPVIKYGDDEEMSEIYYELWEKINAYFDQ